MQLIDKYADDVIQVYMPAAIIYTLKRHIVLQPMPMVLQGDGGAAIGAVLFRWIVKESWNEDGTKNKCNFEFNGSFVSVKIETPEWWGKRDL